MGAWASVVETLSDELGSILDPEQITRIVLRLGMAAIFGAVLGYEREHHGKAAGIRTHMMVAVGSALAVLAQGFSGSHAYARGRHPHPHDGGGGQCAVRAGSGIFRLP